MEIRHGKNSCFVTLGDLTQGDVVSLQDSVWMVTSDTDDTGVVLVDLHDGWSESFPLDIEAVKLNTVLVVDPDEDLLAKYSSDDVDVGDLVEDLGDLPVSSVQSYNDFNLKAEPVASLSQPKKKKKKNR